MCKVIIGGNSKCGLNLVWLYLNWVWLNSNERKNVYELIGGEEDINTKERNNVDTRNIPNLAIAIVAYKKY